MILSISIFAQNAQTLDQKINDLSLKVAKELEINKKKTVAVIDFTDLKFNSNDLGRYLADEMNSKLFLMKKFKVIERTKINKAISEKKLNFDGGIDEKNAQQIQTLFGVDAIIFGTLQDLGKNIKAKVLLLNPQDAEKFSLIESNIDSDEQVASLLGVTNQIPQITRRETASQTTPNEKSPTKINEAEKKKPVKVTTVENFLIELWQCNRKTNSIVCELTITNNGVDRTITTVADASKLYDGAGNNYNGSFVKFSQQSGNEARVPLIQGVSTSFQINFDGISEISKISLIKIYSRLGWGSFDMNFRDVPIK
jgi:TolB-like protein